MLRFLLVLSSLLDIAASPAPAKLALPFLDWGACPFECCVYTNWYAVRRTSVLSARRSNAPVAFRISAGDRVYAITGVVVTSRPGRIEILQPITLGVEPNVVSLKRGDVILTLHRTGEGYGLFWFKGRTYKDQIDFDGIGRPPNTDAFNVLEQPTSVWWVKIRNDRGQVGWSMEPGDFTGNDSCG